MNLSGHLGVVPCKSQRAGVRGGAGHKGLERGEPLAHHQDRAFRKLSLPDRVMIRVLLNRLYFRRGNTLFLPC